MITETAQDISAAGALQVIDSTCQDGVMRAKLRGLMTAYHARWQLQEMNVLEIEQVALSDLYNPATSAKSRSFTMAGKKDIVIEENGRPWLMDHKTSSEDISDPNSPYWRQLVIEGQHQHYMLLDHLNGRRIEGAIWDVVRKPGIRPSQISKTEIIALEAIGKYYQQDVSKEEIAAAKSTGRETESLYEYRLAFDAAVTRPDWYFQRQRIVRLDNELIEYAGELWVHTQDILISRRENRWPRNSGACMNYGRPCMFLGICSGHDTMESDKWRRKGWVHNELPVIDGSDHGRELLTNSRIRTFQTCRKKHYLQYEVGIERNDPEDVETLVFGTIWHEALAVYFEQWKGKSDDNSSNAAAIEVADAQA